MAGITGSMPVASDEQVVQPEINAHHLCGDRQLLGLEFTQTANEVATCRVLGYSDGARFTGQLPTPADRQWLLALGQCPLTGLFDEVGVKSAGKPRRWGRGGWLSEGSCQG